MSSARWCTVHGSFTIHHHHQDHQAAIRPAWSPPFRSIKQKCIRPGLRFACFTCPLPRSELQRNSLRRGVNLADDETPAEAPSSSEPPSPAFPAPAFTILVVPIAPPPPVGAPPFAPQPPGLILIAFSFSSSGIAVARDAYRRPAAADARPRTAVRRDRPPRRALDERWPHAGRGENSGTRTRACAGGSSSGRRGVVITMAPAKRGKISGEHRRE